MQSDEVSGEGDGKSGDAAPAGETVGEHLRRLFPTAKMTTLRQMLADGRVRVGGRRARTMKEPVGEGEIVETSDTKPKRAKGGEEKTLPPLAVLNPLVPIHEDADVLVVYKPSGLLTSTVPGEKRATALDMIRRYCKATAPGARVGLIHRLDKEAAGLLVFSKSHRAYESLKTQFFHHSVDRVYEAIVHGRPKPRRGRIESRLEEFPDGKVHSTQMEGRGQKAVTEYEVVSGRGEGRAARSRVRVKLETGRKHQIRAHLSERGWPIVNDPMYGPVKRPVGQLKLTAVLLAFEHPATGERVTFELPERLKGGKPDVRKAPRAGAKDQGPPR